MAETVQFNMRLDRELKRKLDQAALQDRRSTAALITIILDHWLAGKVYPVGFDQTAITGPTIAERFRPPPGRPRKQSRTGSAATHFTHRASAWLADRTHCSIQELIDGAFSTEASTPTVAHGLPAIARDIFASLGWIERMNSDNERVWLHPSHCN